MRRFFLPLGFSLLLGILLSVALGQDASWDLQNYHLYNAWALLHRRLGLDLDPAGMQSFFNPWPDLPYFWLGTGLLHAFPRWLAAYQGLWFGALSFILYCIARQFAVQHGRPFGGSDLAAVFIGITSTMAVSQAGLSSNEVPIACLVLTSLLLILPGVSVQPPPHRSLRIAMGGLLCGFAAGLKPTAIVYAPALALGLWTALGMRRQAGCSALLFGLTSSLGFIAAYGGWGWELWQLTGNPIFPMFNQVFHSNWAPASSGTDRRFMPHGILQTLFYPYWWIRKNSSLVTEVKFSDARYACAMLAMLCWPWLARWQAGRTCTERRSVRLLFVFVGSAYVLWLGLYAILRYTVPIGALTGLIILVAVQACMERFAALRHHQRYLSRSMYLIACLLLAATHYPQWGHTRYTRHSFDIAPMALAPGSLVLMLSQPSAYVIPFLAHAKDSRFIGITWFNETTRGFELDRRTRAMIQAHRGPLFAVLYDDDKPQAMHYLRQYLPAAGLVGCQPIASGLRGSRQAELRLCRVDR